MNITIIIPATEQTEWFETTLASVLRSRPDHCQIIAFHDGQYTDPHDLCGEVVFSPIRKPTFAKCMSTGLRQADGKLINVIAPGVEVEEHWAARAIDAFVTDKIVALAPKFQSEDGVPLVAQQNWLGKARMVNGHDQTVKPLASRLAGIWRKDYLDILVRSLSEKKLCTLDWDAALFAEAIGLKTKLSAQADYTTNLSDEQIEDCLKLSGFQAQALLLRHGFRNPLLRSMQAALASIAAPFAAGGGIQDFVGRCLAWGGLVSQKKGFVKTMTKLENFAAALKPLTGMTNKPSSRFSRAA